MPALAVTLGDMVRVVFNGWPPNHPKEGQPLVLTWNNRPHVIQQGKDSFVPFDCAKLYFGDPRSVEGVIRIKDDMGNDMIVADRSAEVLRLVQYYQSSEFATNNAKFREFIPGDRSFVKDGVISDLIPDVTVYSLDGQVIPMVTDDPYGDNVIATQQTRAETEIMRSQLMEQSDAITELKKQNRMLLEKLGLDPGFLNPVNEVKKQDPALETPEIATIEEAPKMVYNPRTKRVQPRRPTPGSDPTSIDELPADTE